MTLRLAGISRAFGGRTLFEGVDLELRAGDRIALVGANGVGKTTLLRIAAGLEPPDSGERGCSRGERVVLLRQEIDPARPGTVQAEAASAFAHLDALEAELREVEAEMAREREHVPAALAERYDRLHAHLLREDGFSREAQVDRVLEGLGFDAAARARPLASFSGGWLMRVELAKLLLQDPDFLLLDEPTNHLDLPSLEWFDETLAAFRGGVVLVSHDRAFLRRHALRVAELAGGGSRCSRAAGTSTSKSASAGASRRRPQRSAQDRKIAETERFIERFRAKASKARQVQSRVKALEKLERVEGPAASARRMRLAIPEPARAGAVPLELVGVHKAYGEQVVYRGVDLQIRRGEKVALVGPNGAGKSTLLRILAGVLPFERGERRVGHQVQVAFYAQHQLDALDPRASVLGELERDAALEDHPRLRSHLGAFLFPGDDVQKKVSVLSGGEKARLALAKLLLRPSNVLVLDEPTNHLDVSACEVLESALVDYTGTLVVISHDRAFLNAVATRVIEVKGGALREFLGNYEDYLRRVSGAVEGSAKGPDLPQDKSSEAARAASEAKRQERRAAEKSRRRFSALETEIAERESALEALTLRLSDPDLWRDSEQARRLSADRDALRATLDGLYPEWERLAVLLEPAASE